MYTGSADFETANAQAIQKHRISGTIDGVAFGPSNILAGSFSITNQCSDTSDAKIGGVYLGMLKCTFLTNTNIPLTTWQGRVISVRFDLLIDEDPETWEGFSLGVFTVAQAERNLQGVTITAYDNMSVFDAPVAWDYLPNGHVYDVLDDICTRTGITLATTQAQCEAMPNGTENIALFPGSDVKTYRDILHYLSQVVAGFVTMNGDGELVLKSFIVELSKAGAAPTLPEGKRLTGANISDYVTNFKGVYLYSMKEETVKYYGADGAGGVVYDLGANPFLQYGTASVIRDMCNRIVTGISYHLRPFKAQIMSAPIWELGDRIKLTGGIATGYDTVTVIHGISFTAGRGTVLSCYGANPVLASSDTQNKAAAAASNSAKLSGITYKRDINPSALTISTDPVKVTEIQFTAEKDTEVEVWHEYLITTAPGGGGAMTLTAYYYLDGVLLDRRPVETYEDAAAHILGTQYSWPSDAGVHMWQVYLEASGGTATISPSKGIAVLKGQGISKADTWDGIIYLTDTVPTWEYMASLMGFTELLNVTLYDAELQTFSATIAGYTQANTAGSLTGSLTITLQQPYWPLMIEPIDYLLGTEDGDYLQTEG